MNRTQWAGRRCLKILTPSASTAAYGCRCESEAGPFCGSFFGTYAAPWRLSLLCNLPAIFSSPSSAEVGPC